MTGRNMSGDEKGDRTPEIDIKRLIEENERLREQAGRAFGYIRDKTNQLLTMMGTSALRPEELDDETLIDLDPIGVVSDSFAQVLGHLHETNEKLGIARNEIRAIFDSAGVGILVLDKDKSILDFNRKARESFFGDISEIRGRPCHEVVCRGKTHVGFCTFEKVLETGEMVHQTGWICSGRHFDIIGSPVASDGKVGQVVLAYMDITDRKKTEGALRESENFLQTIIDAEPECVKLVSPDGDLMMINRAGLAMIDAESLEQVKGKSILPLVADEYRNGFLRVVRGVLDGRAGTVEFEMVGFKGRRLFLESHMVPLRNEKDEIISILAITRDITERKRAEEALAAEKELLSVTLRSIGDGVITTDTKGMIVLMNKMAEELTGWAGREAAGRHLDEIFHLLKQKTNEPGESPIRKVFGAGGVLALDERNVLVDRHGKRRIISDSVAPIRDRESRVIGAVLVFRDITEKQKLNEELSKIEKLKSVGLLAGGIAHDFNNLLTAILGNISLSRMYSDPEGEAHRTLIEAEKASLMARDLTQQLLTFSKGGAPVKKAASVVELLKDSTGFVLRGSKVRCDLSLPEDLWPAEIDEGQIGQVINNLIINADHAMPEGGIVEVRAENVRVGIEEGLPLEGGRYVKISFRDQGIGIPREHLPRIFDPYFTTKQKGSGLGLATAYSIIKNHKGYITVESEVGVGTTFNVYLPAASENAPVRKRSGEKEHMGKGKILVMDDEEFVRDVAGSILNKIGYETEYARDGYEAIELYRKAKEAKHPFDAVIMDLTIPGGMGGEEAVRKLREIDPAAKAIVSSGYSNDPIMSDFEKFGFKGVVVKPYTIAEMSKALRAVIVEEEKS